MLLPFRQTRSLYAETGVSATGSVICTENGLSSHIISAPWLRRLITRSLAIIPTIVVVAINGEQGTEKLLILSQVILSLQLSFAVVPLVLFTGNRRMMGEFVNGRALQALAWITAIAIAGLNAWLLIQTAMGR